MYESTHWNSIDTEKALVHIVSILNVTRYATQDNRHSINVLMDKVDETSQDVNNFYNLTTSLATSFSYHQLILYIRSVLAKLWDSLSYIKTVSTHTMDYIDAATTGTLSLHILPNNGSKEDAIPHRRNSTIYTTSPCFIWWCPAFLSLSSYMFWLPTSNAYSLLMYQFRIGHNNSASSKFSLWIFHMVILPLALISALNISELHKMKPWQWKSCHNSSGFVKKQMDSFVPFLHHFNHLQTHCLVLLPCMPRTQPVFLSNVFYKSGKLHMSVCPHSLHPMFRF